MTHFASELAPGTLYSVVELSNQLGVSRTPVREALLQLASNGMVRFERSKGVRILKLSTQDIEEIYMLRIFLEAPAAYHAAQQMPQEHREAFQSAFAGMRAACEVLAGNPAGAAKAVQEHLLGTLRMLIQQSTGDTAGAEEYQPPVIPRLP
ncbi:GntR family transcriptional regulator [Micromonospora sp. WMMD558]|uniref:GntR family transcriptional regulator n=1 Tax=unclassified Micromonospora TaxID=2617518 RepID=UPI0012B4EA75|nr:GntR family transcriptional regulator [Micromonospora sp. WMMC415]QGN49225.1 GntR family transcriptional regulator [Micromonospora sp. WMMC415]